MGYYEGIFMTKKGWAGFLIMQALALAPVTAWSDISVHPLSKTSGEIKAWVAPAEFMQVTDEQGGWPNMLALEQRGNWGTPFAGKMRLRVTALPAKFQVHVAAAPILVNTKNQNQRFAPATLTLAADHGAQAGVAVPLTTAKTMFENPAPAAPGQNSVGYYTLQISAQPPGGNFKEIAGAYEAQLSMTFEPVAQNP